MYLVENYQGHIRFNEQYHELHGFLKAHADSGCNEHFHWGRLDWMMAHPCLDVEMLPKSALFRGENGELVGAAIYDTDFQDRWYLLHSISDETLLREMLEYAAKADAGAAAIKANLHDTQLCGLLKGMGFETQYAESVLELDLPRRLPFQLPQGFYLSAPDSEIDPRQWRLVIHHGFDHEGIPPELSGEAAKAAKHLDRSEYIKVFAVQDGEYAAHCGVWYHGGDTAYIEPVVTVPGHRGRGLGKAVVYEAVNRAKERGAKRAIVLSDQEFYLRIGMKKSSQVATWVKNGS